MQRADVEAVSTSFRPEWPRKLGRNGVEMAFFLGRVSGKSSIEDSSDEEERLSFSFPGEFEQKRLFGSYFGSPYRGAPALPAAESWWSSVTSKLYDLLGVSQEPRAPQLEPFQPSETAIIFDWDDTLFPTYHVIETLNDARGLEL